jgi:protein TonB
MAYADQDGMSTNRLVSVVIVLLLHAFLGYALVTGLAYDAVIAIKEKMTVVDVKEEEPPEEEEPPPEPEKQIEPPVVSPPPMVVTVTPPPSIRTVDTPPPAAPAPEPPWWPAIAWVFAIAVPAWICRGDRCGSSGLAMGPP